MLEIIHFLWYYHQYCVKIRSEELNPGVPPAVSAVLLRSFASRTSLEENMKRLIAFLLIACMVACMCVAAVSAADETTAAVEETTTAVEETTAAAEQTTAAVEETSAAAESEAAPAEESEGPGALRIILLVMQILSCVVLTATIMLQSSKEGGLGALTGNSGNYFGKSKSATLDAKLGRITKWIAAAFVLLTLIVSLLYTAA